MSDSGGISLPGAPQQVPGLPENFHPVAFEGFDGLNTKVPRPAIGDKDLHWCDGWMPIGPNYIRILPGAGPDLFTAPGGLSVVWHGYGNISDIPEGIALLSDGSVWSFNPFTGANFAFMPTGTITNPSTIFGFSQWGSKYLIFTKDQTNGYWLWDGSNVFTAGGVGPEVTITNAGTNYTSAPLVRAQTTGSGSGHVFIATVENGSVTKVTVTSPGTGFAVGDFISLNFTGGGSDDQAVLTVVPQTTSGGVGQVTIVDGGHGYTYRLMVVFTGGGGTGASASASVSNGAITAIAIINSGQGYTSPPNVTITDPGIPGSPAIPGGSGFIGFCSLEMGQITNVGVLSGGTGYVSAPTLSIIGDGVGASGVIQIDNTGAVINVVMQNYGNGYTRALAVAEGGNNAANATVDLMPFGISGTAVEVYQQRVWVTNGAAVSDDPPKNRTIFSAPNSPVDFGNGGGAFQSTDSFLRVGYHWLKQTNGFLYLGGDSSVNYISGVNTSAPSTAGVIAIPTTTFGNQNVDPQLGSPWPSSVQVFSRNIVFANSLGIFVSYGGAVTKASIPLDGFYGSGPIFGETANFSSAVAHIFTVPVYMLLLPVQDIFTNEMSNKLLMWDGKRWFTSQQDKTLTYIAAQELNSVLTAWGTDGSTIFRLFQQPTTSLAFVKVLQSKLFASPAYWVTKTALSLSGVQQANMVDNGLAVFIDNENGQGSGNASTTVLPFSFATWTGAGGAVASWTGAGGVLASWPINGNAGLVFGPIPIGQNGRMLGFTVQTFASDIGLMSMTLSEQVYSPNV